MHRLLDQVVEEKIPIQMKLILISDTHGFTPDLPDGDILLHGGDLTSSGSLRECQIALDWLNAQPHKHIVMVAGNHDFAFENPKCTSRPLDFGRIVYLENSETTIEGLRIYGSPITPKFMDWAFMVPRGEAIRRIWDLIPTDLDVLITHGPPAQILDQAQYNSEHLGCNDLFETVVRVKPRLHMFGHIHGGRGYKNWTFTGTEFFNASMVNEAYRPVHEAWEVDLETKEEVAAPIIVSNETINVERN